MNLRRYALANVSYPKGPVVKVVSPHPYDPGKRTLRVFGTKVNPIGQEVWNHHGDFEVPHDSLHLQGAIDAKSAAELRVEHGVTTEHTRKTVNAAAGGRSVPTGGAQSAGVPTAAPPKAPKVRVLGVTANKPEEAEDVTPGMLLDNKMLPPHDASKDLHDDEATRVFWSRVARGLQVVYRYRRRF